MTINEQLDAFFVHLKDQQIINDSMTFSEKVKITSDFLYQWLIDHNIRVEFHGKRKIGP